jgi:asparaginyl-tRNA synthetase
MIEPEVAYCDLDGLLELAENFLSHIVQSVLKNRGPELKVIGRDRAKLEAILPPFPRLRYDEAVAMLNQAHKAGAPGRAV